ncbi:metal-sulfur cluster assembly factor [Ktedonosporobacter rubrisoli]|uniref:Metal-sulfur cluster assembly factor n=1 Tax=Ktedonosporobacter rubrisoli TaxID=2509675 RepID=A0A4P6JWE8_KTERU|nr:metal-sulfur cluster assembly factor [Ktedonosporobacter rubrisoli]QBD79733.1 metal-sulfur cluster assembly factor [Ktedonosporobacter rubrisoli]
MTTTYPSMQTCPREHASCPSLWDALRDVMDPEIPISVVDMGLIVDIAQHDGCVNLKLTFTAMGCPAMEFIMDDIRQRLLQEPGVEKVDIEVVWDPVWTKERLSEDGIEIMRTWGISA